MENNVCQDAYPCDTITTEVSRVAKSQKEVNAYKTQFNAEKYDIIKATPTKEQGAMIRDAAKRAGQSVSAYILQAVAERMAREIAASVPEEE